MSPHARETRPFAAEVKFVIAADLGQQVRSWARENLEADPYGGGMFNDTYHTTSLYFDTAARDVFHRRRSFGRSKYRVRRYGAADFVFLERKLRKPGVLVKRRTTVALDSISRLSLPIADPDWPGEWFHRRLLLRQITPVCELSYTRVARFARTAEGPARLTLDDNVRVRSAQEPRFSALADVGTVVVPGEMILELKYLYRVPAIFKRLVEEFTLEPQRASKYRFAMTAIGESPFATDLTPSHA
jgi:VTC domain